MADQPMSMSEAARALGISRQRVHGLIRKGALPAVKDDRGQYRLDREAVEKRAGAIDAALHWLTVRDVANIHGVAPKTVRKWAKSGALPSRRALKHNALLFHPAEVANFVPPPTGRPPRS